jgi:DNA-binding MarR family transcriptional regulator
MTAPATKSLVRPPTLRVSDYPFFYMHWIISQNNQNIGDALREHDVTPTTWRVLAILQERDGMSVNELAEASVMDRAFLSGRS